jgi:hypothetical protein
METQKTHWKLLINPAYVGAYCIQQDTVVTVEKVTRELVKGEGGKSEECTIIHLKDNKPFICNRTNAKTITKLYGSPYIEDWVGKTFTLFPTTTKVAGETVECLRIRPTKPTTKAIDYSYQIDQLRSCQTLEQLQATYLAFTADQKTATVTTKDDMKDKLVNRDELKMTAQ